MLFYNLTLTAWSKRNSHKTWKRVVTDALTRHITGTLTIPELQYVAGYAIDILKAWGKSNKVTITVEDVGEDAQLVWLGEKRADRVLLYLHGQCPT